MQKFKKADRERFMSDWRKCLPAMRVYKSMMLMKRNGPILVGLWLKENRANTNYTVNPFVHNLVRPTGFVTLTLRYPLRTKRNTYQDDFTLKSHDREFPDACKRLHSQTIFPLGENLSLSEIINAYDTAMQRKLVIDSLEFLYEDILCYLTWCGKRTEAEKRLTKYIRMMSEWEERIFERDGGRNAFFDRLVEIVENPYKHRDICEEQIKILKVDKLPDYGLTCD